MDKLTERINKAVEELKVIDSKEENITTTTNFIGLKNGTYKLNNGQTIIREKAIKKQGEGNAVCRQA